MSFQNIITQIDVRNKLRMTKQDIYNYLTKIQFHLGNYKERPKYVLFIFTVSNYLLRATKHMSESYGVIYLTK